MSEEESTDRSVYFIIVNYKYGGPMVSAKYISIFSMPPSIGGGRLLGAARGRPWSRQLIITDRRTRKKK